MKEEISISLLNNNANSYQLALDFLNETNKERKENAISLDWIDKIISKADILCIMQESQIVAWLVLYCNNYQTEIAYCAGLRVLESYRRRGFSQGLLDAAIGLCKKRNFKELTLYCNNPIAMNLYKKNGFEILYTREEPKFNNEVMSFLRLQL